MIKSVLFTYISRKIIFFFVVISVTLLGTVALDFSTYQQLTAQEKILNVNVEKVEVDKFLIRIKSKDKSQEFLIEGDQWQLDFRLIRFTPVMALAGVSHVYQLNRLSNRYISINDQASKSMYLYSLRGLKNIDLWQLITSNPSLFPFIDAIFGNSVYMPLKNGAEYEIYIGFSGLVVKPVNQSGKIAVLNWK